MTPKELVERLESAYHFECKTGPLRLCVEWHQLKAALGAATLLENNKRDHDPLCALNSPGIEYRGCTCQTLVDAATPAREGDEPAKIQVYRDEFTVISHEHGAAGWEARIGYWTAHGATCAEALDRLLNGEMASWYAEAARKAAAYQAAAEPSSSREGREALLCPVCSGRGFVAHGFYQSLAPTWSSSDITPEPCQSCDRRGYILTSPASAPAAQSDLATLDCGCQMTKGWRCPVHGQP